MLAPRTDWREHTTAGEDARWERLALKLRDAPRRAPGSADRALHTKRSAGLRAEFRVLPDLPPHARVGIFARPATYRAYARISNGAARRQPDAKPDVRGFAFKVLGVPGAKLLPGLETATTQDFVMIRDAVAPFHGPEEFVWVACAAQRKLSFVPRAIVHLGPMRTYRLLSALRSGLSVPYPSAAVSTFHSALAIRFGEYAVRYSLAAEDQSTPTLPPDAGPDLVHDDLRQRLARGPIHYQFRVQFHVGEDVTPIEDTAVEWRAADSPFVPVARLTLTPQALDDDAGQALAAYVEGLSFDPWHAPVEFRPLGAMMRARRAAYRVSAMARGARPEPEGAEWPA